MELLHFLVDAKIEGIPLPSLKTKLDQVTNNNVLLIKVDNKNKIIKCIREYYTDPETGKKVKKSNIANYCSLLQSAYKIENCNNFNCKECHKKAIDNYYQSLIGIEK